MKKVSSYWEGEGWRWGVVSGAERWGCGEGEERQRETHIHSGKKPNRKTNRFSSIPPPWNDSFSSVSRPHLQQCSQRRQQRANTHTDFSKHRRCRQKSLATASGLTPEGRLALSGSKTKAASARLWLIESPCRLSSTFEQQFGTFCQ